MVQMKLRKHFNKYNGGKRRREMAKSIDQIQKVNYGKIKEAITAFYQKHNASLTDEMGKELFDIVDLIDRESSNEQDLKALIYEIAGKM